LQGGDWAAFWKELGVPISDADRQLMELSDPRAMAAVQLARERSSYFLDPARVRAPTLLYYGSDDDWAPVHAVATAFGIEPRLLPGQHHSAAIRDIAGVIRVVLGFLESVYPARRENP
jgi:pimeloyl-ACP methyl ester carboxylesterase